MSNSSLLPTADQEDLAYLMLYTFVCVLGQLCLRPICPHLHGQAGQTGLRAWTSSCNAGCPCHRTTLLRAGALPALEALI